MLKKWLVVGVAATLLVGCATDEEAPEEQELEPVEEADDEASTDDETATDATEETYEATIILTEDGEEVIEESTVEFTEGDNLMEVMDEYFELTTDADQTFIEGINGYDSNETDDYFWTYTVNDEEIFEGVADYELEPEDEVHFDFAEW
ncbi:hypothetical protein DH09_18935 [Bacillaceae bacterium JMAK1]|nr:hypothetical protein DH09_18935 [Bacillaceae bacterium JMAK1]